MIIPRGLGTGGWWWWWWWWHCGFPSALSHFSILSEGLYFIPLGKVLFLFKCNIADCLKHFLDIQYHIIHNGMERKALYFFANENSLTTFKMCKNLILR